jgi:putative endonuclease
VSNRALGISGEDAVAAWYVERGYEVIARNWRSGRTGELDLIARKGRTYVFCEVKTRTSTAFGAPIEAVGHQKQMRIRRLAAAWLSEQGSGRAGDVRFDIASVLGGRIEVVEGCF